MIGSGVIYCNHKWTVDVVFKDGSKMILANIVYIPGLGVNLLSGMRICEAALTYQFNKSQMYFTCGKNKIITATMQHGLYVITHIKHGYQYNTFFG
jgi:hypothetical protein